MKEVKILVFIILTSYLFLIGRVLFFKNGTIDRQTFFKERVAYLVPFTSTSVNVRQASENGETFLFQAIWLLGGNFVLLLPWGLLAPVLVPSLRHIRQLALSGFFLSLLTESIQFTFRLGVFETDDILLNTAGAVLGCYLFQQLSPRIRAYIPRENKAVKGFCGQ